ncbi:MAG: hypothetical protein ABI402_14140 [Ferruginibacter sp.]
MLRLLTLILLLTTATSQAQPSDFLILKKKDKTIRSYYTGIEMEFVTNTGAYRKAYITSIHNDSLFMKEYIIQQAMTKFGFYVADTLGSYSYSYNYRDIKSIGRKEKKGFNVQGSGGVLLGGGLLLTLASGVVYLADKDKFSPGLLGASVGLAGIGYLMTKINSKAIVIGKRNYHLEYVNLSAQKK